MRALAFTSLLLTVGCHPAPPPPFHAPPPPPPPPVFSRPAPAPAPHFVGFWRVTAVDGRPTPPRQSPILLQVGPELIHARADCANLGEPSFAVRGGVLSVEPPPQRVIGSCARGLSEFETAFTRVFQPGAVGRLRDGDLILERGGRTVEAVRDQR